MGSFASDHIRVHLMAGGTRLSMLLGGRSNDKARPLSRSALQNPELSRYELDCLLRRNERREQPALSGWASLIAATQSGCANSNAVS